MYREFFKFQKSPFHITPDPDFLFLSPSHKEASASIFYGIHGRKGFVAVVGEVGVGKTTVLRSYLDGTDPEKIKIVYVFNPLLSFETLIKKICSDLGIRAEPQGHHELVNILFHHLIEEYRNDRNVVLIIDEAQNMPVETLARLRLLSNLESSRHKLIQIILVGQPELEARLNLPQLRQLKQRIAVRSRIDPLTPNESIAYIHHRLMRASLFHNPVFSKKAMKLIVKKADGIPRKINILCDNALVTAFGYLRKPVGGWIAKEVIRDFRRPSRSGSSWKIRLVPALVSRLGSALFVLRGILSGPENHAARETVPQPKTGPPAACLQPAVVNPSNGKSAPAALISPAAAEGESLAEPPHKKAVVTQLSVNDRVARRRPSGPPRTVISSGRNGGGTRM